MNARYVVFTALLLLVVIGASIKSRSTLDPAHGVDYVFYGGYSDFLAQEMAIGDFNGDHLNDIVTTTRWDGENTCDADTGTVPGCAYDSLSVRWKFVKGADTLMVCGWSDPYSGSHEWQYWVNCGYEPIDTVNCGECVDAHWQSLDRGAAYVFMGGDWSARQRDNDLATSSSVADHMFVGTSSGDLLYNGMAAGDVDGDGYDELALGMTEDGISLQLPGKHFGPGEVCIVGGDSPGRPWPAAGVAEIRIPDDSLVTHVFAGRRSGDDFGMGIAVGDLDHDGRAEIVVAAPKGDAKDSLRVDSGVIYVFYANDALDSLKTDLDLSTYATDQDMIDNNAAFMQVIWGAADSCHTGVTTIPEIHPEDGRPGDYDPVALAIGDWDGDNYKDLVIGAGDADSGAGAVYVIFGGPRSVLFRKLKPGNTLDLANDPGTSGGPDIKFTGKNGPTQLGGAAGAGVAFVDADGQGSGSGVTADLLIGAPRIDPVRYTPAAYDSGLTRGEVYLIFGDNRTNLVAGGTTRDLNNAGSVDVTIKGQAFNEELGGHMSGNFDIDDDGKNDVGIAGFDDAYVFFGQSRSSWPSTIDLTTSAREHPTTRYISWAGVPRAGSTTIRLMDLDGDGNGDLAFGGYDLPGYSYPSFEAQHAGQMWVTKGTDMWKGGTISANTSWSGYVFVNHDITVQSGVTLTLDAGTAIYVWPIDVDSSGADPSRVEFNVEGQLVLNGTSQSPITIDSWEPQNADDWEGFYFDSGSSGAAFNHCTIRHAEYAIESYVDLTVENSRIEDFEYAGLLAQDGLLTVTNTVIDGAGTGSFGVFLTSASANLQNVTVRNCEGSAIDVQPNASLVAQGCTMRDSETGIYVNNAANAVMDTLCAINSNNVGVHLYNTDLPAPTITNCTIDSNTTGVYCEYYSHPSINQSMMQFDGTAVYCIDHSSPIITSSVITNSSNGILAAEDANPDIGRHGSTGQNSIYMSSAYHVANLTVGLTINAEDNWWNSSLGPHANKISGSVDYDPWLTTNPQALMFYLPEAGKKNVPKRFALGAAVPNPFNPETTIRYDVPKPGSNVTIRIYDVAGRLVSELVNEHKAPGFYETRWDGTSRQGVSVASGIYFVQMKSPTFNQSRKLVLLK